MALRDQLAEKPLPADPLTEKDTQAIADVALGITSKEAARFLLDRLLMVLDSARLLPPPIKHPLEPSREMILRWFHHVARYGAADMVERLINLVRRARAADLRYQAEILKAINQGTQERGSQLNMPARQWAEKLVERLLASHSGDEMILGAELAGALQVKRSEKTLVERASRKASPEPERRAALDALVALDSKKQRPFLERLLGDASEPVGLRERSVEALASFNQAETDAVLLKALEVVPAGLQHAIADRLVNTPQGAERLVGAVAAGKASARLLQDNWIQIRVDKYANLKKQVTALTQGLPSADERLQKLLDERRTRFSTAKTDVAQGARVFEKSCAICHQLGGKGAKVGPHLDGVGNRGLDRILEDILDPNRNVDQAFRATTIALKSGQVLTGLVLREEGEVVVLADEQGKEIRVTKNSIEERNMSPKSPMPATLVDQIPEADFYHLIAYLLSLRSSQVGKAGP
jgi:putative heme-binding domain-containing protein